MLTRPTIFCFPPDRRARLELHQAFRIRQLHHKIITATPPTHSCWPPEKLRRPARAIAAELIFLSAHYILAPISILPCLCKLSGKARFFSTGRRWKKRVTIERKWPFLSA
ncbi:hypothetical protein AYJ54_37280 [Bradyrhizobium centrolobii]|uniref:Uncharacterized protein n=1 Tax=Bradyrhizobium centrolobii TaxID=1505087 RepID=A0A176Z8I9_9BRAD|nr:hypothetical protein AYJ54_37280 [Bradyrhizobium centrolobii]